MSTSPSPVTAADVEAYRRDGATCVRRAFDPQVISRLREAAERILVAGDDAGLLPQYPARYLARRVEPFRRFVFDSSLGAVAGAVLESRTIRLLFDDIFAKKPRSSEVTPWHTDRTAWPCEGLKIPSVWIPLGPIRHENSLEVIAGSHLQDVRYWNLTANARQMSRPPQEPMYPDCEPLRADPDVRFLTWEMEPGDVLFVHPWALHYSGGNPTDEWRFAYSVRVLGDDVTWQPRPQCLNIAGISFDEMIPGERPDGPLVPLLWSASGEAEGDRDYPRGFALRWSSEARRERDANQYALFARTLASLGGPSAAPEIAAGSAVTSPHDAGPLDRSP